MQKTATAFCAIRILNFNRWRFLVCNAIAAFEEDFLEVRTTNEKDD